MTTVKSQRTSLRDLKSRPKSDYVSVAIAYAETAIEDGKGKTHGQWIRLAAKRFIGDLKRAQKARTPFYFSADRANDACWFIELLPHVEGVWERLTIKLDPFQVFFIVQLYGFRNEDGGRRFSTALFAIARKNAKALALDTLIPTPLGWTTMGAICAGDVVFGANGQPCRVTAVSPVYTDHDCFRMRFSNGEEVTADAGHRWLTTARDECRASRPRVRTTSEIAETLRYGARGDINHSLAMPTPIVCDEASLPVDPYALGAWLGDGHSAVARITFSPADVEIAEGIRAAGIPVRAMYSNGSNAVTYVLSDGDRRQAARNVSLASRLRRLGVLNNKHVPNQYLRASVNQRIALLQGLMDTDGTISKNGRVISYTSVREQLAAGVAELLSSLGVKFSWRRDRLVCNGREVPGVGHKLQFMAFRDELPVFRLQRKMDRMRSRSECAIAPRSRTVQIVAADPAASVPVKCITVDSPDSLFLFGRSMLPTHNSTLAAAILLYCFCEEAEIGPQILSAATTGDQARIVWGIAKRMVEKTSDLREQYGIEAFSNVIARYMNGGTFKPINAKASTQDGLNPSALCFDELHAHKTHDLVNVLKSAAGARKNPLFLYTTTEGYETPGPWPEERNFARQILLGVVEADHYLAIIYAVDDKDDDFDESKWVKANPLMLSNLGLAGKIRENALEAKQKPGSLSEFRIKRLNRQSATATGYVHLPKWNKCNGKVTLDELAGSPCWGAFDLASTTDMAAWFLLWLKDGTYYTWGRYWVPSEAVKQRTERKTVNYQAWVDAGFVTMTDGDVTDYDVIEKEILEDFRRFSPQSIAYDSWNATALANRLVTNGVTPATDKNPNGLQQFIQGPRSYNPAMNAFEKAYLDGKLVHGGNLVLTWNAANLVARTDVNMNKAPDKKKSADKIDGIVCLLMAFGLAAMKEEKRYQAFFL